MKGADCPRMFEVEALRDGRLAGKERRDFERHLASCRACAREQAALDELGEALRVSAPPDDELHVRRERTRLLAAFDRSLLEPSHRTWPWQRLLLLAAAATLLTTGLLIWRAERPEPVSIPRAVVHAAAGTQWTRRAEGERDLVFLDAGKLRIHVAGAARAHTLLVVLPDGEIEHIGTTFSVTVEAERTKRVAVEEGAVLLSLRGHDAIRLGAGTEWTAEAVAPPADPPANASAHPAAPPSPSAAARIPSQGAPSASPPLSAPSAPSASHAAADEFRAAMAARRAGRNAEAAALFARFIARYPGDPRAQDAAYVRILCLRAAGELDAMRSAAAGYLRDYPDGFRRAEVEAIAR